MTNGLGGGCLLFSQQITERESRLRTAFFRSLLGLAGGWTGPMIGKKRRAAPGSKNSCPRSHPLTSDA